MTLAQDNFTRQENRIGRLPVSARPNILEHFKNFFTISREPQILEEKDRQGQVSWKVYAPFSDKFLQLQSEQDVLVYLEERHYHHSKGNGWDMQQW